MSTIDLDAARRAKAEVDEEPGVLVLEGREFKLKAGAPAGFLVGLGRLQKGDMNGLEEALQALLFDPSEVSELLRLGFGLGDLGPLAEGVYGIKMGESSASG